MDYDLFPKLWTWAKRRHGRQNRTFIAHKYWRLEKGSWKFATKDGFERPSWTWSTSVDKLHKGDTLILPV